MLKCFDYLCPSCKYEKLDVIMPQEQRTLECPDCGGTMERAWLGAPSSVVGDECDVTMQHGLCNADGSPRRYTSKSEMRREAEKRGLVSHVEHKPGKGTDKSKHTQRWI